VTGQVLSVGALFGGGLGGGLGGGIGPLQRNKGCGSGIRDAAAESGMRQRNQGWAAEVE
jgi:hypothetical protein